MGERGIYRMNLSHKIRLRNYVQLSGEILSSNEQELVICKM